MDTTIMRRVGAIAAAAGLALGGGVVAGSLGQDSASAAGSRTLVYDSTFIPSENKSVDLAPKGHSPGDTSVDVASLAKGGRPAGRIHAVTTIVDKQGEGIQWDFTVFVAGGTIVASGGGVHKPIPGAPQPAGDMVAVIGGTGTYAGASGTLLFGAEDSKGRAKVTIRLR